MIFSLCSLFLQFPALAPTGAPPILELPFWLTATRPKYVFPGLFCITLRPIYIWITCTTTSPLSSPTATASSLSKFLFCFFGIQGSRSVLCLTTNPVSLFSHVTYVSLWPLFILSSSCVVLIRRRSGRGGISIFYLGFISSSIIFFDLSLLGDSETTMDPISRFVQIDLYDTTKILVVPLTSTHDFCHPSQGLSRT